MAKKKAAKKVPAEKVAPSIKAQAEFCAAQAECGVLRHRIHLHNISAKTANWSLSGRGNRAKGISPTGGESCVGVDHAKRYKVTFWVKPDKKVDVVVGPDGSAIYNGNKAFATHPH